MTAADAMYGASRSSRSKPLAQRQSIKLNQNRVSHTSSTEFRNAGKSKHGTQKLSHRGNDQILDNEEACNGDYVTYEIKYNGSARHVVRRTTEAIAEWYDLPALGSVDCHGTECFVGDDVSVMVDGQDEACMARILDIRSLQDAEACKLLLVAWYYSPKDMENLLRKFQLKPSQGHGHVPSTHLDIIPRDSVIDRIEQIAAESVFDISQRPPRLVRADDKRVAWLSGLQRLCRIAAECKKNLHAQITRSNMTALRTTCKTALSTPEYLAERSKSQGRDCSPDLQRDLGCASVDERSISTFRSSSTIPPLSYQYPSSVIEENPSPEETLESAARITTFDEARIKPVAQYDKTDTPTAHGATPPSSLACSNLVKPQVATDNVASPAAGFYDNEDWRSGAVAEDHIDIGSTIMPERPAKKRKRQEPDGSSLEESYHIRMHKFSYVLSMPREEQRVEARMSADGQKPSPEINAYMQSPLRATPNTLEDEPLNMGQKLTKTDQSLPDIGRAKKEVWYLRYILQSRLLSKGKQSQYQDISEVAKFFRMLESYSHLDQSIIRETKIDKVLRKIEKDQAIPCDKFDFRSRARALSDRWRRLSVSRSDESGYHNNG